MDLFRLDIRGISEFEQAVARLNYGHAKKIADQTINRMGASVAKEVREELAAKLPYLSKLLKDRVRWWRGSALQPARLRIVGTGKKGMGFVRPRYLGLSMPRVGRFENGKPRFGSPAISRPAPREYPGAFVLVAEKGSKRGGRKGAGMKAGRHLKIWGGTKRGMDRALVFRRVGWERYPITQIPGYRLAELTDIKPVMEAARKRMVQRVGDEIMRRIQAALNDADQPAME